MSWFSVESFCPAVPKKFVGEPFYAEFQKISSSEKVYGEKREMGIKIFRRNFFVAQCQIFS